jgi:2'-5' RNA ligase
MGNYKIVISDQWGKGLVSRVWNTEHRIPDNIYFMKRTFIAIDIEPTPKFKEDYDMIRYRLRTEKINWVSDHQLHITLNFLGDTDEKMLPQIGQSIQRITSEGKIFKLILRSLGIFKSLREPRVIWIGCDKCSELEQMKKEVDRCLAGFGFESERREFSPHLTLGRIKGMYQQNQLSQLIALYKEVVMQEQFVDKIILYESKLSVTGPEHLKIQEFFLKE